MDKKLVFSELSTRCLKIFKVGQLGERLRKNTMKMKFRRKF
ncbi:hypothetical protein HMPREF9413_3349 [Paenibacillus sp. HGF7]|nr:hypothetical protein HMPREF9413_3349 [Paenibacillus sp. HGF7]